jgi:hypothetical protein
MLRTSRAIALGVHPRILYGLRDSGRLQQVSCGLYRLTDLPELGNPDLAAVAARIPQRTRSYRYLMNTTDLPAPL